MSGIGGGGGGGGVVTTGEAAGFRGARAMIEQMNRQKDSAGAAAALRPTTSPPATVNAAAARSAESAPSDRRPFKEVQKQQQQQQQHQPAGQVAALARQLRNIAGPTAGVVAASNGAIGSRGGECSVAGLGQRTTAAAFSSTATGAAAFKISPTAASKLPHSPRPALSPKANNATHSGNDEAQESWPTPPLEMHKLMREMQSEHNKRHEGVRLSQALVDQTASGDALSRPGTDSSGWKKSPTPPPPPLNKPTALRGTPVVQNTLSPPLGPPVALRPAGFDFGRAAAVRAPPEGLPSAVAAPVATATTPQTVASTSPSVTRTPPALPVKPKSQRSPSTGSGDSDEPVASSLAGRSVKDMAKFLSNKTAVAAAIPPASEVASLRRQVLDESGVAYERLPFPTTDMPSGPPPPKPASLAAQLVVLPTLQWAHETSKSEDGSTDSANRPQQSLSSPQPSTSTASRRAMSDSSRPPPSGPRQIVSMIEPMQSDEETYDDTLENEVFPAPPQPVLPERPAKPLPVVPAANGGSHNSSAASAVVQEGDEDDTYDDLGVDGELYDDAKPEAGAAPPPRPESISSSSSETKAAPAIDRKESKKRQKQAEQEALRLKKEEQERLAKEELALEEERRQREKMAKKAAKVKQALEKDQAKIRKKFKLKDEGDAFIGLATMRDAYTPKPGTQELPYSAEEVLYVVVKDGCPKGKWLARNTANLLGFIACDGIVGSSMHPRELGSPLPDPIAEDDEEVEYADAEIDDFATIKPTHPSVRPDGSAHGGGGTSAVQCDETYDDTGAAEPEENEDIYELAD